MNPIDEKHEIDMIYNLDLSQYQIQQLIQQSGLDDKTLKDLTKDQKERDKKIHENQQLLKENLERKWMVKHQKTHLLQFDDKERQKLKQYFRSLDADGSGNIGVEELEEPLISLGIVDTREDVKKIIKIVDKDGTQEIEFPEFLNIISGKEAIGNTAVVNFFKDMIDGKISGGETSKNLSFQTIISIVRRRKLLDALMEKDQVKKKEGQKVLHAYGKLLALKKFRSNQDDNESVSSQTKLQNSSKLKNTTANKKK